LSRLPAVELLRRELMAAVGTGEKITLVPSAPLTNIALLLRTYPEVAAGIDRIIFMGGSATVGNATVAAEFNVWHDPEAAAIALAAVGELDIPVTMYGLDVFNDVLITRAEAARLRDHLDPGAQLAGSLIGFACDTFGSEAASIGDAGTVCAVVDPAGLSTESWPVLVELGDGFARGQTLVDRRTWIGDVKADVQRVAPTQIDVALAVDARRYADLWLTTVGG
jgi:pyrimidine-specific ribonucleoside hydrolase